MSVDKFPETRLAEPDNAGHLRAERNPRLSVIIATRGRPQSLCDCVTSVLACEHDSFEVIVVEQNEEPTSLPDDPRIVHIMHRGCGKSAALNIGISAARAPILAFTDDDCTVPPDWLTKAESFFAGHDDVVMAFGNLTAMEHDPKIFFVPDTIVTRLQILKGFEAVRVRLGAGADLVARRSMFADIGGFDEQIGPGARFPACEEYDLYCRALEAGYSVALTPDLDVTHWGVRPYADGSAHKLLRSYEYGHGAVLAKHLRLGNWRVVEPISKILWSSFKHMVNTFVRGEINEAHVFACRLRGVIAGCLRRVDRERRVYRS